MHSNDRTRDGVKQQPARPWRCAGCDARMTYPHALTGRGPLGRGPLCLDCFELGQADPAFRAAVAHAVRQGLSLPELRADDPDCTAADHITVATLHSGVSA